MTAVVSQTSVLFNYDHPCIMDEKKPGTAVNGAKGSQDSKQTENEAKEKVNKTLILRQQIEENR